MVLRESDGRRVRGQVVQPDYVGGVQQEAQDPLASGQVADLRHRRSVHPTVHEGAQRSVRGPHAERTELGSGQLDGGGHDARQRRLEVEISPDLEEDLEQPLHLVAAGQQLIEVLVHAAHEPSASELREG